MKPFGSIRVALAVFAVAVTGCGAAPVPVPEPVRTGGWTAADATRQDLLYAATIEGRVFVFSYPHGGVVATFNVATGDGVWGACADAAGDVFITSEQSSTQSFIYEYAHGGTTPIAALRDDGYVASDCSSDPATGDLAVTNFDETSNGGSNVAIYRRARGKPRRYVDSRMSVAFCGYDARGNLFVDGDGDYQLAELKKDGTRLENIRLNEQLVSPRGVEWHGNELAIEDAGFARKFSAIDRLRLSRSRGTVTGTTHLENLANRGATFWIQGAHILIAGGQQHNRVGLWNYPAGGHPIKLFRGTGIRGETLYGVTVSVAPNRAQDSR